jgi:hypothetical protein
LVKEIGSYYGMAYPDLSFSGNNLPDVIRPEARSLFIESYFKGTFENGEYIRKYSSSEIINSDIPQKILLKNMGTIANLDFVQIGPKRAMEQFSPGSSVVTDEYIKSIFSSWLKFDSLAASKYLTELTSDKSKARLLVPIISSYSRATGDESAAKEWNNYYNSLQ